MDDKKKYPRARVMWFCTNCYAPDGSKILTLDDAKSICEKHIVQLDIYAMIMHDIDPHTDESIAERESRRKQLYVEKYRLFAEKMGLNIDSNTESGFEFNAICDDEAKRIVDFYYPVKKAGDKKEVHIHVLLKFKNARYINEIAEWFGIPVNMIDIVKGRKSFEDCAAYLVHKKQLDKAQYDAESVIANFDYPDWLENQILKDTLHDKYRQSIHSIYDVVNAVAHDGMSLEDAEEAVSTPIFLKHGKMFRDARAKYIWQYLPLPGIRNVYYIDGNGKSGVGKSLLSMAVCKQIAKNFGALPNSENFNLSRYVYKVGSKGVAWDKYDGQPIVLIDDRTSRDMLMEFGGHDGVKNLLEMFPQEKESKNVKYGNVCVVAQYIVINGIETYKDFIIGLNAGYKINGITVDSDSDIMQYARRIMGIAHTNEEEIAYYINKGILEGTREYGQYMKIASVRNNLIKGAKMCKGDALDYLEVQATSPLLDKVQRMQIEMNDKIENVELIPSELLDATISDSEIINELDIRSVPKYHPDYLGADPKRIPPNDGKDHFNIYFADNIRDDIKYEFSEHGVVKDYKHESKDDKSLEPVGGYDGKDNNGFDPYAAYDPNAMM